MKFELDESQKAKLNKWTDKIKKRHGEIGLLEFSFTPIGMGCIVEVHSKMTDKTLDLTEVEKW